MRTAALSSLAVATLLIPVAPSLAQPADAARIDRMTMSSGGVAEVHRVVDVDGDAVMRIDVPVAQVDDVLKSLLVQDPQGALVSVTLAGPAPVQEAFSALPFTAESMGSPADLLKSLPGTRVRASSGGRTIEGAVLGTNTIERKDSSGEILPVSTLSVLTDDKRIDTLRLGPDTALDILDAPMRDRVAAAVAALGKSGADQFRTVEIAVKGTGKRSVGLDYVSAAPVWKPAFRLVLGKNGHARLQGWAVLENATGQDWNGVDLTLMSGAPVTLTQKLYERYWRERPDLPVIAGASNLPRTDDSAELARADESVASRAMAKSAYADARRPMVAMAAPPPSPAPLAPMSAPAQAAAAQESDISVSFHLPTPVTLARGQTLSVPFIDVEVPAERLALFQPDMRTRNPVSAVMLKNSSGSSLPPGILTVYEADSGFVGDAQMPAVPASEQRLASFAADRKVEISSEIKPEQRITRVTVSKGVLNAETLSRRVTTYTVKGAADAPRTVVIEHPRLAGWTTQSAQSDAATAAYQRLRVSVGMGATVRVEATDERPGTTAYALADADAQALTIWSNAPAMPELGAKLKELAQARAKLAHAERVLADLDAKLAQQNDNQARLRENLGAVPQDSELGRRYLDLMAASENTIASLAAQRDTATAARDALKQAFGQTISTM
jgi:hypothetical protein